MLRALPLRANSPITSHSTLIVNQRSCQLKPSFRQAPFSIPIGRPLHDAALVTSMIAAAENVAAAAAEDGSEGEVDLLGLTVVKAEAVEIYPS